MSVIQESEVFIGKLMKNSKKELLDDIKELLGHIELFDIDERIELINQIRLAISEHSPLKNEPVDCVLWVKNDQVRANDYNPNSVAPPEMELLKVSIEADGYTQPIVSMEAAKDYEVVDGFHRNRVGKEYPSITKRVYGYLPIVTIKKSQEDKANRMASTIRHNRARGKHKVEAMSDIVRELKNRNWANERIAKNLGMDEDEILRLCQIQGLAELFADQEFSQSWDVEGSITESDFFELTDDVSTYGETYRVVNSTDENRIFHTYDKWECNKAGFYATTKDGMTKQECEEAYRDFLSNIPLFENTLEKVITEWKYSCEHYLTNIAMNRIAWLGQASACYALGIPATYRGGFYLLTEEQQDRANESALRYLNKWLISNRLDPITMEEATSNNRQSDIY